MPTCRARRWRRAVLAVPLLLGCTPSPTPPAAVPAGAPQRIVSLAPAVTEMLFAVGAGPRVVGVTTFCNFPAAATTRTRVGGVLPKTVNYETIVALKPDLVLSSGIGQEVAVAELQRLGLRAEHVNTNGLDDVRSALLRIGELTGTAPTAVTVVARIDRDLAALMDLVAPYAARQRPRVLLEVWPEPLMTVGGRTYLSALIERAGGRNIFDDLSEDYPQISAEEVVRRDPELILGAMRQGDGITAAALRVRPGWSGIHAVRAGRVRAFDDDVVHRPGPRVAAALALLIAAVHPAAATAATAIVAAP